MAVLTATGDVTLASHTASGTARTIKRAAGAVTMAAVVVGAGAALLAPKVWLNETETKTAADEMTVTSFNLSGTSITFTDPVGPPIGSLFLGVENRNDDTLGWIAVNITGSKSGSGAVSMAAITATGVASAGDSPKTASGAAVPMASPTAAGVAILAPRIWLNATQTLTAATPMTLTGWNAAGTSATFTDPIGAPYEATNLGVENRNAGGGDANTGWIAVTITGSRTGSGTPSTDAVTASGTATKSGAAKTASGTPSIDSPTALGVSDIIKRASGTPSIDAVTASGVALVEFKFARGHGSPYYTGSHTEATNPDFHLTDDTANWPVDTLLGNEVRNITDGSWAIIIDNTAEAAV